MTIQLSQLVLVAGILAFGVYAFRLRNVLLDRIIYTVLFVAALILVLVPELSTDVAHLIGIGRGVDLVLYMFVIFSLFRFVSLASSLARLERQITNLTREVAIRNPETGQADSSRRS